MKKYICPLCKKTTQVIRYGYRKKCYDSCVKHAQKQNDQIRNKRLFSLVRDYQSDPLVTSLLISLHKESPEHIAYRNIKNAPLTTNLIECYNSHLEARLFPLKGFESYAHAKLWMNGYILKRRCTKLADCSKKFKHLNGCRPIHKT